MIWRHAWWSIFTSAGPLGWYACIHCKRLSSCIWSKFLPAWLVSASISECLFIYIHQFSDIQVRKIYAVFVFPYEIIPVPVYSVAWIFCLKNYQNRFFFKNLNTMVFLCLSWNLLLNYAMSTNFSWKLFLDHQNWQTLNFNLLVSLSNWVLKFANIKCVLTCKNVGACVCSYFGESHWKYNSLVGSIMICIMWSSVGALWCFMGHSQGSGHCHSTLYIWSSC